MQKPPERSGGFFVALTTESTEVSQSTRGNFVAVVLLLEKLETTNL
tara:strand:- start:2276 stop:2413 length:138 start_codon:yes stop_codon:yes gene_type:complete